MPRELVAWMGPVAFPMAPGTAKPGATEIQTSCKASDCGPLGDMWLDSDGRRIPKWLKHMGSDHSRFDSIIMGGYSAGGNLAKRLIEHPEDAKLVRALHMADALYTSGWEDAATRTPPPVPAMINFGIEAASGNKVLVCTGNPTGGAPYAEVTENLRRLRRDIEREMGMLFEETAMPLVPPPSVAYKLGNCWIAEYPYFPLGHQHHILVPQIWPGILIPTYDALPMAGVTPTGPGPHTSDLETQKTPAGQPLLDDERTTAEIGLLGAGAAMAGGAIVGFLFVRALARVAL